MDEMLADDVAVVTGGASGIGREICVTLAEHGADVVVVDKRESPRQGGVPTHERIQKETAQSAVYAACDVSDLDDLESAVARADEFGGVSILVNNAGISHINDFLETTEVEYDQLMDINLKAPFFASQFAAKRMVAADTEGSIVNISSTSGIAGRPRGVRYCTSKGGIRLMTYALAAELGSHGIRANAICPGVIETGLTTGDHDMYETGSAAAYKQSTPLGRIGQPKNIADAVLYLVSPYADFITAETIVVDGGETNTRRMDVDLEGDH